MWSRPTFSRAMRPASSSTLRCFETAFSDRSKGAAISVTRAGPPARRDRIARRAGCATAPRTVLSSSFTENIQPDG